MSTTTITAARLRDMHAQATKAPWHTVEQPWRPSGVGTHVISGSDDPHAGTPVLDSIAIEEWPTDSGGPDYTQSDTDLGIVCELRNALPQLAKLAQKAEDFEKNMAEKSRRHEEASAKLRDALARIDAMCRAMAHARSLLDLINHRGFGQGHVAQPTGHDITYAINKLGAAMSDEPSRDTRPPLAENEYLDRDGVVWVMTRAVAGFYRKDQMPATTQPGGDA